VNAIAEVPIVLIALLALATILMLKFGPPSRETIHYVVELANTKGGSIMILGCMSMFFFIIGIRLVYWSANMEIDHKLESDNAMVLSAMQWITGSAFGGAFGAMIKTMTGDDPSRKATITVESPETPQPPPEKPAA
jgi:uncharacterized membrane protein